MYVCKALAPLRKPYYISICTRFRFHCPKMLVKPLLVFHVSVVMVARAPPTLPRSDPIATLIYEPRQTWRTRARTGSPPGACPRCPPGRGCSSGRCFSGLSPGGLTGQSVLILEYSWKPFSLCSIYISKKSILPKVLFLHGWSRRSERERWWRQPWGILSIQFWPPCSGHSWPDCFREAKP